MKKTYAIFQLNRECEGYRAKAFESLKWLKEAPKLEDYNKVYEGEIEDKGNDLAMCEELYMIFNMRHPSDFTGHSLSVSDIVLVGENYYYCDSFGFAKICA